MTSESQLALFRSCLHITPHLLRTRGSTLTCAKLLVIARLVHKVLAASTDKTVLKTLSTRLANARQKLLRLIDRRFTKLTVTNQDLVECMTAFALTTSSTPSDVLKHFLSIRLSALGHTEDDQAVQTSLPRRISLLVHTFRDVKACFPELVTTSLKLLGTSPLLEDEALLHLDELRLDIHLRWLPDDIRNFTPYTRHDELNRSKTSEVLLKWSQHAYDALIVAAEHDIRAVPDLKDVLVLRREVITSWLSAARLARGTRWRDTLSRLRSLFVRQSQSLIEEYAKDLRLSISNAVIRTVDEWQQETKGSSTRTDLWSQSLSSMELSGGAAEFRRSIIECRTGSNEAIVRLIEALGNGRRQVEEIREVLKMAKDIKWEYDDDDDDDEDEEGTPILALSKTDPMELNSTCHTAYSTIITELEGLLQAQYREQTPSFESANSPGPFLVRSLRETRYHLPRLLQDPQKTSTKGLFCMDLVRQLQTNLAESMTAKGESMFKTSLSAVIDSRHNVQSLWIGSPPLPIQPATATMKYLRQLVKDMESMGTDLWSIDALIELKIVQQSSIANRIDVKLAALDDIVSNQHAREPLSNGTQHVNEENDTETAKPADVTPESKDTHAEQTSSETADRRESVLETLGIPNGKTGDDNEESSTDRDMDKVPQPTEEAPSNHLTARKRSLSAQTATGQPTQITAKLVQLYFDVLYLDAALSHQPEPSTGEVPALQALARKLKSKADLDEMAESRISKSVSEYWRRTYLLFGLLVGQ